MDDPNLFLILRSANAHTRDIFSDFRNHDWLITPPDASTESTDDCSRGTTPIDCEIPCAVLGLTLAKKPKQVGRGYTFGRSDNCDVILSQRSISAVHFSVTFDPQNRIVLKDSSTNGTIVSYQDEKMQDPRRNFTWIIFPDQDSIKATVGDPRRGQVEFTFEFPTRYNYFDYHESLTAYLQEIADLDPPLGLLDIASRNTTAAPSEAVSPRNRPQYLIKDVLGKGTYGIVRLAVDVSTGCHYASKQFIDGDWAREVETVRRLSHEHIVRCVDFLTGTKPALIMEYCPLGNLEDQHGNATITPVECAAILVQGTDALEYLHGKQLAHRDIKPSNILVESRQPFRLKLSDFGFAKDALQLTSYCGTVLYSAPEIHIAKPYTTAVDIWSLGVVVYQYGYGLPLHKKEWSPQYWISRLLKKFDDEDSDPLIDFLATNMLKKDQQERTSAVVCHQRSLERFRDDVYPTLLPCSPTVSSGNKRSFTTLDLPPSSETRVANALKAFLQDSGKSVEREQAVSGSRLQKSTGSRKASKRRCSVVSQSDSITSSRILLDLMYSNHFHETTPSIHPDRGYTHDRVPYGLLAGSSSLQTKINRDKSSDNVSILDQTLQEGGFVQSIGMDNPRRRPRCGECIEWGRRCDRGNVCGSCKTAGLACIYPPKKIGRTRSLPSKEQIHT